jgi:hypothetical protein
MEVKQFRNVALFATTKDWLVISLVLSLLSRHLYLVIANDKFGHRLEYSLPRKLLRALNLCKLQRSLFAFLGFLCGLHGFPNFSRYCSMINSDVFSLTTIFVDIIMASDVCPTRGVPSQVKTLAPPMLGNKSGIVSNNKNDNVSHPS